MSQHLKVKVTWEQQQLSSLEVWTNIRNRWEREPLEPNGLEAAHAVQTICGFWICKGKGTLPHLE